MLKLDRYLLGDFVQSFLATLIVLLVVSVGGVLVDILGNIADGRLPAAAVLAAGPAVHRLPAADPAAGADAGPAAGHRPPVPRLGDGGHHRDRVGPKRCCGRC